MGAHQRRSESLGRIGLALVLAACCVSVTISSKPDLPTGRFPSGFKVGTTIDTPVQVSIEAKKANTVKACINVDPDIHFAYSWTGMPDSAAGMVAQSMIAQEEETSDIAGIKTEPIGKEGLKYGTLIFKKTTTPQIGLNCPPWITYAGTWAAPVSGGVLIISVSNVAGSKDAIKGWIEGLIP